MARAKHEGRLWLRTVLVAAVASGLLQLAVWYVGDASQTGSRWFWQWIAWRAVGIHGLITLAYTLWPKQAPAGAEEDRPRPLAKRLLGVLAK